MVKNLRDLINKFSDETVCREHLIKQRWPDGNVKCQYCGHNKCYRIENGDRFKCANNKCYKRFRVTVGSIFEASNIPLTKWFPAMYLIMSHKKGISSIQLGKDIGVTQKTAWFMLHRIREQLKANNSPMLSGTVEVDETFIGGIVGNMSKTRRAKLRTESGGTVQNKIMVVGMLQRDGNLRLTAVGKETGRHILQPIVKKNISNESFLITDSSNNYEGLRQEYAGHETVNHSDQEYVRPNGIHTNSIEGAFSMLKRSILGIYHSVSPKHLSRYCDETSYRYNTRKLKDPVRFDLSLMNVEGRLRYKDLIYNPDPINISNKTTPVLDIKRRSYPVYQYQDGVLLNRFNSIGEAARSTGLTSEMIRRVLNGKRKSTGGFTWEYA